MLSDSSPDSVESSRLDIETASRPTLQNATGFSAVRASIGATNDVVVNGTSWQHSILVDFWVSTSECIAGALDFKMARRLHFKSNRVQRRLSTNQCNERRCTEWRVEATLNSGRLSGVDARVE